MINLTPIFICVLFTFWKKSKKIDLNQKNQLNKKKINDLIRMKKIKKITNPAPITGLPLTHLLSNHDQEPSLSSYHVTVLIGQSSVLSPPSFLFALRRLKATLATSD